MTLTHIFLTSLATVTDVCRFTNLKREREKKKYQNSSIKSIIKVAFIYLAKSETSETPFSYEHQEPVAC